MDSLKANIISAQSFFSEGCRICYETPKDIKYVQILDTMDRTACNSYTCCIRCFQAFQASDRNKRLNVREGKIVGWVSPITANFLEFSECQKAKITAQYKDSESLIVPTPQTLFLEIFKIIKIWDSFDSYQLGAWQQVSQEVSQIKPDIDESDVNAFVSAIGQNNKHFLKYIVVSWNKKIQLHGVAMKEHRIEGKFWFEFLLERFFNLNDRANVRCCDLRKNTQILIAQLKQIELENKINSSFDPLNFLCHYPNLELLEFFIECKYIPLGREHVVEKFSNKQLRYRENILSSRNYDQRNRSMQISTIELLQYLNTILPNCKFSLTFSNFLMLSSARHFELVTSFGLVYTHIEDRKIDDSFFHLFKYLSLLQSSLLEKEVSLPFTADFYIGPSPNTKPLQEFLIDMLKKCRGLLIGKHTYVIDSLDGFEDIEDRELLDRRLKNLAVDQSKRLPILEKIDKPAIDFYAGEYNFNRLFLSFSDEVKKNLIDIIKYYKIRQSDLFITAWRQFRQITIEQQKHLKRALQDSPSFGPKRARSC